MGLKNLKPLPRECLEHLWTLLCLHWSSAFLLHPTPSQIALWNPYQRESNVRRLWSSVNGNHEPQIPLFSDYPPVIMYHNAEMTSFTLQIRLPDELPAEQRLRGFGCLGYSNRDTEVSGQEGPSFLSHLTLHRQTGLFQYYSSRCRILCTETPVKVGKR